MARPKTAAAMYERVTFRLPPVLLAMVRAYVAETGVPLNTALIQMVWRGVESQKPPVMPERARRAASPAP